MDLPDFHPVKSSNVQGVAHHKGDLYVKFHGGAVWKYSGVPAELHNRMLTSGSVGSFFSQHIRNNHDFKAEQVDQQVAKTA